MRYPAHFVRSLNGKLEEWHRLGGITEHELSVLRARVKVASKPQYHDTLHRLWGATELGRRVARSVREAKIGN